MTTDPEYLGAPLHRRKDIFPERKYSFETSPAPIRENEIKQTVTTQILVIGAGLAGLSAALSAREVGAEVILIEKTHVFQA